MIPTTALTRDDLARRDAEDPLASCRELFELPEGVLYFDGNSLGPVPKASRDRVLEVTDEQWGRGLIRSWNLHGWIDLPRRVGARIARLIGARPHEVLAADSTSVNLFKLLSAALRLRPERRVLLSLEDDFPTDRYIAWSLSDGAATGHQLRLAALDELGEALTDDVAVLFMSHVHYKTSALHDMAALTRLAHERGALVLWDLSHSVGALDVDLGGADADLAVGCGYKFLNGGPGCPAFLFVAERLHDEARSPLTGWLGHEDPFAFARAYRPGSGVDRFACGTPSILSLAALDAALDVFDRASLVDIRRKSLAMGELFQRLVDERLAGHGLTLASPAEPAARGSHLSLRHREGFAVMQALIDRGVIGDFRPPDLMRFGFAPLYQRYTELWDGIERLRQVLEQELWRDPRYTRRGAVT